MGELVGSGRGKPRATMAMAPDVGLNFPRGITVATKGVVQLANYLFGVALDVKAWTCPAPPLPCGDSNEIHRVGGGGVQPFATATFTSSTTSI